LGAPTLGSGINIGQGLALEALGTAILVLAVMGTAVDTRAVAGWAPLAIGLTLVALILLLGPATGGSVNPARAFGPDVVAVFYGFPVDWVAFVVSYLLGPLLGGVVGAFTYIAVAALPRPTEATTTVGGQRPRAEEAPQQAPKETHQGTPGEKPRSGGDFDERAGQPVT
jgi:glycerol uptake facilitator protein